MPWIQRSFISFWDVDLLLCHLIKHSIWKEILVKHFKIFLKKGREEEMRKKLERRWREWEVKGENRKGEGKEVRRREGEKREESSYVNNLIFLYLEQKYSPWKITCCSGFNGHFKRKWWHCSLNKIHSHWEKRIFSHGNEQFHEPPRDHMVTTNLVA